MIYDARELYLQRETHGFASKVGCFFESRMIAKAALTICANEERKQVMEKEYGKIGAILVFENFRKLSYSKEFSEEVMKLKFDYLNGDDSFKNRFNSWLRDRKEAQRNLSKQHRN